MTKAKALGVNARFNMDESLSPEERAILIKALGTATSVYELVDKLGISPSNAYMKLNLWSHKGWVVKTKSKKLGTMFQTVKLVLGGKRGAKTN